MRTSILAIYIAIAGSIGVLSRYGVIILKNANSNLLELPWSTLLVNCLGCYFIGLFYELLERQVISNDIYMVLSVGFLGGFTTFSGFAFDLDILLRNEHNILFTIYAFGMPWLGYGLIKLGRACVIHSFH